MADSGEVSAPAASASVHDFERIFREDGPGLWRTIYAFTGGRHAMTEDVSPRPSRVR